MKRLFTKFLLLTATILVGGVNSAFAEDVPYQIISSESAYTDQANSTTNFNGADQTQLSVYYTQYRDWGSLDGYVKVNAGGKMVFYKFPLSSISSAEGTFKSASVKVHGKSSDSSKNADLQRFLGYNAEWSASTITNSNVSQVSGTITGLVTSTGSFQPLDSKGTYSVTPSGSDITVDATTYVGSAIENGKTYVTIAIAANTTRTSYYNTTAELTIVYSTADVVKYSVKFVDMEGNELKPSLINQEGLAGETVVLPNEWKASFVKDGVKYVYDSDDAPATYSDGAIITIKFREAQKFNYSVTTNQSTEITSGNDYEGTNISFAYSKFILIGTELYESAKQGSNPWWGSSFVLDSDNKNVVINYNKVKDNVVFCSEAEDLTGASKATGSNAEIRCSNKAGGYAGGNVTVTTLPAGKYKLYTSVWGNAGKTITFKVGENTIGSFDTKGYIQDYNTEDFVLASEETITFSGTDSSHPVDFVYIQKTGDVYTKTLGTTGFATFSAACPVTVPAGVTVYQSTCDGETLTATPCAATVIPANTGVIVKGTKGTEYTFVPTETAGSAITTALTAAPAGITSEGNICALLKDEMTFAKVMSGVTLGANTAYLPISAGAKNIRVVVGGATGIENVASAKATNKAVKRIMNGQFVIEKAGKMYNAAGQVTK